MEEMLLSDNTPDKEGYYREVMQSILETGQSDAMIIALSGVIQALAIDRLHIIGDIFDRGPRADLIMDALENYHQVDVQWGNHDIAWMGAAALSEACIAQVIVTSVKYGNLETLEVGYGISLRPLATLAAACYADDPCEAFLPRDNGEGAARGRNGAGAHAQGSRHSAIQARRAAAQPPSGILYGEPPDSAPY